MILRTVGLIASWFIICCLLEALHGVATGLGLLPYPGKGVIGPIDWFLIVISVPLAITLNRAFRRRRSRPTMTDAQPPSARSLVRPIEDHMQRGFRDLPAPLKLFVLILVGISFVPPFLFGHSGASFWSALVWCPVLSIETVWNGWRAPRGGIIGSLLFGLVPAALWCVPTYWLGRLI